MKTDFCTFKLLLSSKSFIRMAGVKVCRISSADYIYKEFFAFFALLSHSYLKTLLQVDNSEKFVFLLAAGTVNKLN